MTGIANAMLYDLNDAMEMLSMAEKENGTVFDFCRTIKQRPYRMHVIGVNDAELKIGCCCCH